MKQDEASSLEMSDADLTIWSNKDYWSAQEAIQLALGAYPFGEPTHHAKRYIDAAIGAGWRYASPLAWLWWGERNNVPFTIDWWLVVSPQGPIGYDGRHFCLLRKEILSPEYTKRERELIIEWARKPYWTKREAIDLSLNFAPFTTDGWQGDAPETGATIREREDRFLIFDRALELGEIKEKAAPAEYLNWLSDKGYYVSLAWRRCFELAIEQPIDGEQTNQFERSKLEELQLLLTAKDEQIAALESELRQKQSGIDRGTERSALNQRLNTLQKILAAMAVDAYRYSPLEKKAKAPQEIADKSIQLGCPVSQQTIRKHLRNACDEHVDAEYWSSIAL